MKFREFFNKSTFSLLRQEPDENWDYYLMEGPGNSAPIVVALAKPGSGCKDCFFGSLDYFQRRMRERSQAAVQ